MSDRLSAWLAILQAGQSGAEAWQTALAQCGGPERLCRTPAQQLTGCGLSDSAVARLRNPDAQRLSQWQNWLESPENRLLTVDEPDFPQRLRDTPGGPLAIWLRGPGVDLLEAPQLAIVGSRNATMGGKANARGFARALGGSGLTITSGLAAGIDAAAHAGAVHTTGGTLAVLGSGIDLVYPGENAALADEIASTGLIASEYGPGTPPRRHHFPARNRIIAALSLGVLVVEAGARSGSLITARLAGELGREVFAIPGSIHNPLARGCHQLIRQGAKLVEEANDVLGELAPLLRETLEAPTCGPERHDGRGDEPETAARLTPEYASLLDAVGFDPTELGEIVRRSTLTTAEVSSMLLLLELEGHVEALPGGRYIRVT
ncbi:MAG: DNA-processing protein DprA [Gammaproteobacteria bacterium]|jgi:DNA processing protein